MRTAERRRKPSHRRSAAHVIWPSTRRCSTGAPACGRSARWWRALRIRTRRCCSAGRAGSARISSPAPSTPPRGAAMARSSRSTARPSLKSFSSPNCSATKREPSPEPTAGSRGSSSTPTRERSTSTRSPIFPWPSKPSSCTSCRTSASPGSGGYGMIDVDARVVAATNRDLEHTLARGDFREDLYYRLNVVEISIPPLRDRKEEILLLAARFLAKFNQQYGRNKELSPEETARLLEYPWRGNVRELENMIRRIVVLQDGEQAFEHLVARRWQMEPAAPRSSSLSTEGLRDIARRGAQEAERKALAEVLDRVQWNRAEAARILKVSYKTLLNKIAERRLKPPPSLQFG